MNQVAIGQPIEMLVPERLRASLPGLRAAFLAGPRPRPMGAGREFFGVMKDGREFPVEMGVNSIEIDEGPMVLAAVVDISQRKAVELVLREEERRNRSLAAIVSSDLDRTVTSWNEPAERLFKYAAPEMIGEPIQRIAAPGQSGDMTPLIEQVKRGERVDHHETMGRRKDGSIVHISLTVWPIYDAEGRLVGVSRRHRLFRHVADRNRRRIASAVAFVTTARFEYINRSSKLVLVDLNQRNSNQRDGRKMNA